MRSHEFIVESVESAQTWIERVYAKYPQTWQNNHVMPLGDEQFAMFELVPSMSKRGAVEVKWFQAYPLRQGVGSRAMQELQALAREDGIALTLFPWDKGQVSQAKLTKFYRGQGFKPSVKGGKAMSWEPVAERKQGPLEDFEGLQFKMVQDEGQLFVYALDSTWGNELGHVTFNIGDSRELDPQDLFVKEKVRGQGIARLMYDFVKNKGYKIVRSWDQTDDGAGFWNKHRGEDSRVWESELNEISDEQLQSYLSRADRQVSNRMDRMSQARERLNKGYEIYHADRPAGSTQIVDRFEAGTPALAQRYYEKFIQGYESDVDFDLRLRRNTGIMEIARIPQGDFGDKDTLLPMSTKPETKPLPGGSGFSYAVNKQDPEFMEIMIFDGDTLAAELDLFATLDPLNTWGIETVATDPDYRGRGLGKALYGIALNILKLTLEAGATQTKHGQAMWIMLNSIPGVEVLGYAMEPTEDYRQKRGDQIVDQNATWTRYTFPVEPGRRSMRSTRRGTGIYSSNRVSMVAKWTGS